MNVETLALLNTGGLLVIAALNVWGNSLLRQTRQDAAETREVAVRTEVNTNHMREQLVTATGIASHAEGREEGRAEGEAKAAILAEGKLQQ